MSRYQRALVLALKTSARDACGTANSSANARGSAGIHYAPPAICVRPCLSAFALSRPVANADAATRHSLSPHLPGKAGDARHQQHDTAPAIEPDRRLIRVPFRLHRSTLFRRTVAGHPRAEHLGPPGRRLVVQAEPRAD